MDIKAVLEKVTRVLKKNKFIVFAGAALLLLAVVLLIAYTIRKDEPVPISDSGYSSEEKKLAEEVKIYLNEYFNLKEEQQDKIADEAVMNYRVIMKSGTQSITDAHTKALNEKMGNILDKYITGINQEEKEAFVSGINRIIFDTILNQLEQSTIAGTEDYREEYQVLTKSLQAQIDALKKKSTAINITAHIKSNDKEIADTKNEIKDVSDELTSIKQTIENMTTGENGKDGTDGKNGANGKDGADGKDGIDGKDGADGRNGVDGKDGINGKDGADGKDGRDGKDGADGKNGADGKSTYIAYADDSSGKNFSFTPTETSKYIGSCVTASASQPTDASQYKWQLYRSYIIQSETDANNNTTIYIK